MGEGFLPGCGAALVDTPEELLPGGRDTVLSVFLTSLDFAPKSSSSLSLELSTDNMRLRDFSCVADDSTAEETGAAETLRFGAAGLRLLLLAGASSTCELLIVGDARKLA